MIFVNAQIVTAFSSVRHSAWQVSQKQFSMENIPSILRILLRLLKGFFLFHPSFSLYTLIKNSYSIYPFCQFTKSPKYGILFL